MKRNIILGLVIVIIIIAISSCSIFGVGTTMTDRINSFENNLNGSRSNIIDNIHLDAPGYNTANNDNYWLTNDPWDPGNKPFSITNISESSSSVSASFHWGGTDTTIFFEMKDDGDFFSGEDWKIWSCSVNGSNQF